MNLTQSSATASVNNISAQGIFQRKRKRNKLLCLKERRGSSYSTSSDEILDEIEHFGPPLGS